MTLSMLSAPAPSAYTAPSLRNVASQVDKAVARGHAAYRDDASRLPSVDRDDRSLIAAAMDSIGTPPRLSHEDRELTLIRRLHRERTSQQDRAQRGHEFGGTSRIWKKELQRWQRGVDADTAQQGEQLLLDTLHVTHRATDRAKNIHERDRPYVVDDRIKALRLLPTSDHRSFPSGHSSSAHAAATVLSALDPPQSERLLGMARDVALSRVYAGVHFPTDVAAGAHLGTYVADHMIARQGAALVAASRPPQLAA